MKTILFILVMIIILLIFYCINNKISIKWRTFKEKGFAPKRGVFGLYVYDGKQGKGKTYSLVEYLLDNVSSICVFCNVKDIVGIDYFWYQGFDELIKLKHIIDYEFTDGDDLKKYILKEGFVEDRANHLTNLILQMKENDLQLVMVYDEIFTELQKQSKLNKEVIDFLCQMRKRCIIFLTTAQEWAEIPLTFRRFCRYEIKCNMINFLGLGLLFKQFNDAENMKWDEEQQEHIAPLIETTLTKCRKRIANSYNTFLRISSSTAIVAPVEKKEEIKKLDVDIWGDSTIEELEEPVPLFKIER